MYIQPIFTFNQKVLNETRQQWLDLFMFDWIICLGVCSDKFKRNLISFRV